MKFNKYYLLKPIILSITLTVGINILFIFLSLDINKMNEISEEILSILITFTLTFIAFSITAFTILQLLQSKEWYSQVSNTKEFKSFISRLFLSIKMSMLVFISSIISYFIIQFDDEKIYLIVISLSLFIMVFLIVWIWDCINDFIKLFN